MEVIVKTLLVLALVTFGSLAHAADANLYRCLFYAKDGLAGSSSVDAKSEKDATIRVTSLSLATTDKGDLVISDRCTNRDNDKIECQPIIDIQCSLMQ